MTVSQYIQKVNKLYKEGRATEHTYRGDLRDLLESLVTDVVVTNEPRRVDCGAPDYIITKNDIPIGYIEAKDVGKDLGHKEHKEQFGRYKKSLNNLIITDYLDFWFYVDGELVTKVQIGNIQGNTILPLPLNYDHFTALIRNFCTYVGQTIKSASKLSVMMADKAKLLSEVIESALNSDVENAEDSSLKEQMHAFKEILIHDITPKEFADIYAQTIAYGMFAARIHDKTLNTFSRQEAAELIPKSNPFLRKLFQYVAGYDLDSRIVWIVDALAGIFRATDVASILQNFGNATKTHDPIIHFYETFLAEYDPALRKARGVWYTPAPVVTFIVRAVDDILKVEFGLSHGLADNSKIKILLDTQNQDKRTTSRYKKTEEEVHRVQILDPATGTGTFLAEVIKQVHSKFKGQQGIWNNYVENHLIPRLNGFELLMASYAMAHLKMDMLLLETGFTATKNQRFKIYLTNSLEEHHQDTGTIFANWLSSEANEANHIKRDTPVMVVMGNPPYSISSSNRSIDSEGNKTWIGNLIDDYKKDLNERKINLDDDYIKFLRFSQYFIDKNKQGVIAMITNNSYIDGITHRRMRESLSKTFNKLYIIDLHGNSSKQEKALDGSKDENVFDIKQGVSICLFIKSNTNEKTTVNHFELLGKREFKYDFLLNNSIATIPFTELKLDKKNFFFTNKDLSQANYQNYISLADLFELYNSGIQTKCDELAINTSINELQKVIKTFRTETIEELKNSYKGKSESSGWNFTNAKNDLLSSKLVSIEKYNYRPFDHRYVIYTETSSGFLGRPRTIVMKHFVNRDNLGLSLMRQFFQDVPYSHTYITDSLIDERTMYSNRGGTYLFPLYVYTDHSGQLFKEEEITRKPNLKFELVKKIALNLNLTFINEKNSNPNTFAPIDILDYIYAILHSPTYREKYNEFLKIDFPRIPYPKNTETFWDLVKLGVNLRQLHLLESKEVDNYITGYPQDGDNIVVKTSFDAGKVHINETQYFENVPEVAWNFYIGGYQPAQKWLKDRKGRELSFDDILHYQRMIVALTETDRLMQEIDKVEFE